MPKLTPSCNHEHRAEETCAWFGETVTDVREVTIHGQCLAPVGFAMIGSRFAGV